MYMYTPHRCLTLRDVSPQRTATQTLHVTQACRANSTLDAARAPTRLHVLLLVVRQAKVAVHIVDFERHADAVAREDDRLVQRLALVG